MFHVSVIQDVVLFGFGIVLVVEMIVNSLMDPVIELKKINEGNSFLLLLACCFILVNPYMNLTLILKVNQYVIMDCYDVVNCLILPIGFTRLVENC